MPTAGDENTRTISTAVAAAGVGATGVIKNTLTYKKIYIKIVSSSTPRCIKRTISAAIAGVDATEVFLFFLWRPFSRHMLVKNVVWCLERSLMYV